MYRLTEVEPEPKSEHREYPNSDQRAMLPYMLPPGHAKLHVSFCVPRIASGPTETEYAIRNTIARPEFIPNKKNARRSGDRRGQREKRCYFVFVVVAETLTPPPLPPI